MVLLAIYRKPKLRRVGLGKYIHPCLLLGLEIIRPNQVWANDRTYIPIAKEVPYFATVIELYSRFVGGWNNSNSLDTESSHSVLRKAWEVHCSPEIVNSDHASKLTFKELGAMLKESMITISMDSRGQDLDNIFTEQL
jgi:putative transposase